jgi:chemotaxis protein MotB
MASSAESERNAAKLVWVITFIDLITLMLTFFVMMYAMSTPDGGRYHDLAIGLGKTFGGANRPGDTAAGADFNVMNELKRAGLDLDYVANLVEGQMVGDEVLRRAVVHRLPDRLVISLPGDVIFASNSAVLTQPARAALHHLTTLLVNLSNRIAVQGHTDPNPIRAGQFASNWELSLARAGAVADALKVSGYEKGLAVQGFGETRYVDLDTAIAPARRFQIARRVDIVVTSAR